MGISYTNGKIYVVDGEYTFSDIYNELRDYRVIEKRGNAFFINVDIYVGDDNRPTSLITENEYIYIDASEFQIFEKAYFRSGVLESNGGTHSGSTIYMTNPRLGYGFGNKRLTSRGETRSGDIFLYDSNIKIWCFWGFFNDSTKQKVEIIDCNINGFGRISGRESILTNVVFERSNGRYGILAAKGSLKRMDNYKTMKSIDNNRNRCSLYFNPKYSPGMVIENGTFGGYDKLVYCEEDPNSIGRIRPSGIAKLLNCEIYGSKICHHTTNETEVRIVYSIEGVVQDIRGNLITNAPINIYRDNDYVETIYSNTDGSFYYEMISEIDRRNEHINYREYLFKIEKNDLTGIYSIIPNKKYENMIFRLVDSSTSSGCNCSNEIQAVMDKLNNLENIYRETERVEQSTLEYIKETTTQGWDVII